MDEFEDDLEAGIGGLEKIDGGLSGDLGEQAAGAAAVQSARRGRYTQARPGAGNLIDPRPGLAMGAAVLILIVVLVILL